MCLSLLSCIACFVEGLHLSVVVEKTQLAKFKHVIRRLARHAVSVKDEWIFHTDYSRIPKLTSLAVEGRQPAIRGMPKVQKDDAETIVSAVLSMRGADKKKHKETPENGELMRAIKRLPMQGTVQMWRTACGQEEKWNAVTGGSTTGGVAEEPLRVIKCPCCKEESCTRKLKLKVKFVFSNLACKICGQVTANLAWRCNCDPLWYKCERHLHENACK